MRRRRKRPMTSQVLAAMIMVAVLAGCGTSLQDQVGDSFWVTPRKYAVHDCRQLQNQARGLATRQKELEELMARAAQGPGGGVVGTLAYRTEYQQVLGEGRGVAAMMTEKRCQIEGDSSSGRSVF